MADIFTNLTAGVLSAAPGLSGTTFQSVNFANLPAVASPNTLRLTIDPDGALGFVPEIVLVTAHGAGSDTCTVVRQQETSYGGGAERAWPIDTVWRHSLTRASIVELMVPAGTIEMYAGITAPDGYLMLDGSTVAGADASYPSLWAVAPATWKSGSSLVLPNMANVFPAGAVGGAVGAVGGANTHTLLQAELPAATISINPPATTITVDPPATTVSVNPPITNTAGQSVTHHHGYTAPSGVGFGGTSTPSVSDLTTVAANTGDASADHIHAVDIPPFDVVVDIAPFTASVDIAPFNSGNLGSGTPIDIRPSFLAMSFIIKAH